MISPPAFENTAGSKTLSRHSNDAMFWIAVGACCVLICFSITNVSLWIDEGFTAWLVAHPSIASVAAALASPFLGSASDRQYPLYVLWVWSWARLFGSSEVALRSANMPFGVLYILALALPCRYMFSRPFAWIPFAIVPFVWFYMNEARSYMMLTSMATAATAAAIAYVYGPQAFRPRAAWLFAGFILLALLTNVLAVLVFPGLALFAMLGLRVSSAPRWREWIGPALVVGPLIILAIAFYAFTFLGSGGRSELRANQRDAPSVAFAGQILYEDAGFDGLGPPRNDLREKPTKIAARYAAFLLFGAVALALAVLLALRNSYDPRARQLLLAWIVSTVLSVVVSYFLHTRFLGRHLAATLPLLLFGLIALTRYRASLVLLAAIFLVSDIRLCMLPEYWKDDYRGAVQFVISRAQTTPCTIDWAADDNTAGYYGLALTHSGHVGLERYLYVGWPERARGVAAAFMRPGSVGTMLEAQLAQEKPVYLALSKPDTFDSYHGWQDAIDEYHPAVVATYRAFTIYRFSSAKKR
jgi:MFS family permease